MLRYVVSIRGTLPARHVQATASVRTQTMTAPRFALCPGRRTTTSKVGTCTISTLRANKTLKLTIAARIRKKVTAGTQATLTIAVAAPGVSQAKTSITAVVGHSAPSPTPVTPSTSTATLSPLPGTTVTPNNLSGLFPVVTPAPSPSQPGVRRRPGRSAGLTTTAAGQPIGSRLIGAQLVGLVVLAVAVILAIARLSLRRSVSLTRSEAHPTTDHLPDHGKET